MPKRCLTCRRTNPDSAYPLRITSGRCTRGLVCRPCEMRKGEWMALDRRPTALDYRTHIRLDASERALVARAVNAYVAYRDWDSRRRGSKRRAPVNDGKFKAYKLTTAEDILEIVWRTDVRRWHQLCVLVAMTATERLEAAA